MGADRPFKRVAMSYLEETKLKCGRLKERQNEEEERFLKKNQKSSSKKCRHILTYSRPTDLDGTNAAWWWTMFGNEGAKLDYQHHRQAINIQPAEPDDESVRSTSELFITSRHFAAAAWARTCCHLLLLVCIAAALTVVCAWESINSMTLSLFMCVSERTQIKYVLFLQREEMPKANIQVSPNKMCNLSYRYIRN